MANDKFSFPKNGLALSACAYCKHKHEETPTCDAFPEGIPVEILAMKNDHTEPFEGDHGIRFEPEFAESMPVRFKE